VLAWLLHHQPELFVLIGPRTRAQLEEALAAAALRLDAETLAELARP
jgi:aryl-alcohol dehydrogenase-like predicted oxidoreductase